MNKIKTGLCAVLLGLGATFAPNLHAQSFVLTPQDTSPNAIYQELSTKIIKEGVEAPNLGSELETCYELREDNKIPYRQNGERKKKIEIIKFCQNGDNSLGGIEFRDYFQGEESYKVYELTQFPSRKVILTSRSTDSHGNLLYYSTNQAEADFFLTVLFAFISR